MARHPVQPDGVLDRLIAVVSPRAALLRRQARMGLAITASFGQGGYIGASRKRTATQEWRAGELGGNGALLPDLAVLRGRSQDLVRNNPIARGAINNVVTSVVGTGLQARPRIDRVALGMTDAEADAWQAAALREWNAWAYSQEADLARTHTFDAIQAIAFRAVLGDGDHFVAKRYLVRPGSTLGLKAQLIPAARVCNPGRKSDTATIMGGVEIDPTTGAPVAYHVANRHPEEFFPGGAPLVWDRVPAFGEQSGMRQVLHLMRPLEAGVVRGEPYLAPVIESLRQCGTYTDAELTAAVVNSCFAVTSKTTTAEGVDLAASGSTDEKRDAIVLGKPGTMVDLGLDETLESFTPGRPSAAFDPFMQAMLRQIGMALEQPYEVLVKHFEASYSAARGALLEAWRFYRGLRDWHAFALCQPFYEAVLVEAIARGRLAAPGFLADPMTRAAWTACEWYGQAPGTLDPLKEVEAQGKAISYGLTTGERATIELNGGDWDANHKRLALEQGARRAAGLITPPAATGPDPAAPTNEPQQLPNRSA
jgi:lambda family phage portal protein